MIEKRSNVMMFLFLALFCFSANAQTQSEPEIARRVISFYDPNSLDDLQESPIHRHLEIVLNHLGLKVSHRPINQALPTDDEMKDVRAVVTWFYKDHVLDDPAPYCEWLSHQMAKGIKWVALQKAGFLAPGSSDLSPQCVQTFRDLGVDYLGESTEDELFLEIKEHDAKMVEFERELNFTEDMRYVLIRPRDPQTHVYLQMQRSDLDNSLSSLVFTTPKGGFANAGFVIYENKVLSKIKWRLNPFAFFEEALALKGLPKPDVSTLNGNRVFMTHLDGDGIFNVSNIDRQSFSGEIILNKIFKKYTDLPFSVSIITGYLDMPEYENERAMRLYGDIFGLDHVEVASHGYAHPLIWKTGEVAVNVPGYKYDPKFEIQGSVTKLRELLKTLGINKPVDTFFWTGDCLPTAEQIAYANDFGLLNINGGDSRYDRIYDSYAFLSPHGLNREGMQQVYASFPNENVFTNLWKGPYYGFRDVIESFRNTENPIRLKAIDIYYHFYSGERQASLNALELVYDYATQQEIFPIFTSDYARMVLDFYQTKVIPLKDGFLIRNQGQVKTVRFDDEARQVDLARSKGVLGFRHFQNSLYVSLDDGLEHEIYLTNNLPSKPYVVQTTFHVKNWSGDQRQLLFEKGGWLKSNAVLAGFLPNQNYKVVESDLVQNVRSDANGVLNLAFKNIEKTGTETKVSVTLESIQK